MDVLSTVIEKFVKQSQEILGNNLAGIYLHGSAVMGCFNEKKSDIDLLVVTHNDLSTEDKLRYMDMMVEVNDLAPSKGIELSIIKKSEPTISSARFIAALSLLSRGFACTLMIGIFPTPSICLADLKNP